MAAAKLKIAEPTSLKDFSEVAKPAEDTGTLAQWQAWTVQAGGLAKQTKEEYEQAGRKATVRAFEFGLGLFFTREAFRKRRQELREEKKKLKEEQSWTRWYTEQGWNAPTISAYINAYLTCRDDPSALQAPLYEVRLRGDDTECSQDPLTVGETGWLKRTGHWGYKLFRGDKVVCTRITDGRHYWQVVEGRAFKNKKVREQELHIQPGCIAHSRVEPDPADQPNKVNKVNPPRTHVDAKTATAPKPPKSPVELEPERDPSEGVPSEVYAILSILHDVGEEIRVCEMDSCWADMIACKLQEILEHLDLDTGEEDEE